MGVLLAGGGVVATTTRGAVRPEPAAARGGILGGLAAEPELLDGASLTRDDGRLAPSGATVRPAVAFDQGVAKRALAVAEAVPTLRVRPFDARTDLCPRWRSCRARRKREHGDEGESESAAGSRHQSSS